MPSQVRIHLPIRIPIQFPPNQNSHPGVYKGFPSRSRIRFHSIRIALVQKGGQVLGAESASGMSKPNSTYSRGRAVATMLSWNSVTARHVSRSMSVQRLRRTPSGLAMILPSGCVLKQPDSKGTCLRTARIRDRRLCAERM